MRGAPTNEVDRKNKINLVKNVVPDWPDEDIIPILEQCQFDAQMAINFIVDGVAKRGGEDWTTVNRKPKIETKISTQPKNDENSKRRSQRQNNGGEAREKREPKEGQQRRERKEGRDNKEEQNRRSDNRKRNYNKGSNRSNHVGDSKVDSSSSNQEPHINNTQSIPPNNPPDNKPLPTQTETPKQNFNKTISPNNFQTTTDSPAPTTTSNNNPPNSWRRDNNIIKEQTKILSDREPVNVKQQTQAETNFSVQPPQNTTPSSSSSTTTPSPASSSSVAHNNANNNPSNYSGRYTARSWQPKPPKSTPLQLAIEEEPKNLISNQLPSSPTPTNSSTPHTNNLPSTLTSPTTATPNSTVTPSTTSAPSSGLQSTSHIAPVKPPGPTSGPVGTNGVSASPVQLPSNVSVVDTTFDVQFGSMNNSENHVSSKPQDTKSKTPNSQPHLEKEHQTPTSLNQPNQFPNQFNQIAPQYIPPGHIGYQILPSGHYQPLGQVHERNENHSTSSTTETESSTAPPPQTHQTPLAQTIHPYSYLPNFMPYHYPYDSSDPNSMPAPIIYDQAYQSNYQRPPSPNSQNESNKFQTQRMNNAQQNYNPKFAQDPNNSNNSQQNAQNTSQPLQQPPYAPYTALGSPLYTYPPYQYPYQNPQINTPAYAFTPHRWPAPYPPNFTPSSTYPPSTVTPMNNAYPDEFPMSAPGGFFSVPMPTPTANQQNGPNKFPPTQGINPELQQPYKHQQEYKYQTAPIHQSRTEGGTPNSNTSYNSYFPQQPPFTQTMSTNQTSASANYPFVQQPPQHYRNQPYN